MIQHIFPIMPTFVCAFWAVLLILLNFEKRSEPTRILATFMVVAMALYFCHATFFYEQTATMPITDTIYILANLAVFPLYYIYIFRLTSSSVKTRNILWVLLPSIIFGTGVGIVYLLMSHEEQMCYINEYLYQFQLYQDTKLISYQCTLHNVARVVFALEVILVLIFGLKRLNAYNAALPNKYVDVEERSLTAHSRMLVYFVVVSFLSFFFNIIGRSQFAHSYLVVIPSVLFSVMIFALGMIGLRMHNMRFTNEDTDAVNEPQSVAADDEPDPTVGTTISDSQISELASKIRSLVEEKQLYLRYDLKSKDLIAELCTNHYYFSLAFGSMHCTFADYINNLRIQHAVSLIKENRSLKLTEIMLESGYLSEASFFRNFKRIMGCTPKQYIAGCNAS